MPRSKDRGQVFGKFKGILMRIEVKVIPYASKNELIKTETGYTARIASAPVDGKANEALIALLSNKLGVAKKDIEIIKGITSRNKIILLKRMPSDT